MAWALIIASTRKAIAAVPWQVWLIVGLLLAGVASTAYVHHLGYAAGEAGALQNVKEANDASEAAADKGSAGVDECYRSGGTWDRARGVCHHGTPRQ